MTEGQKSVAPLRRRESVGHDQLVGHWLDRHAPAVKAHMRPDRYSITFFDPHDGRAAFDGMAAIYHADVERARATFGRNTPAEVVNDGFVDLVVQPMLWFIVNEHVIVSSATPEEREQAYKLTFLVRPNDPADFERVQRHWLDAHAPNVASQFLAAGGVRYVVNLARPSTRHPFAGVAELWYRDRDAAKAHRIADDGFNGLTSGIALPGREHVVVA